MMSRQSIMRPPKMTAMTLLEVMLSLAFLGGSIAAVGELVRVSFQNAQIARDTIQAELLADSILAKIRLGIIEMEPVFDTPVGSAYTTNQADFVEDTHAVSEGNISDILWYYSIEITNVETYLDSALGDNLVEVAVTVRQNIPESRRPIVCRLVRWIALEPEEEEDEQ